jgi:PIN domain nuclease of toxin-antitoxin system
MILIDTHVWLWLLHNPSQLSEKAQAAINSPEHQDSLLVSAISVWEIAVKSSLGKLTLPLPIEEWYQLAKSHCGLEFVRGDRAFLHHTEKSANRFYLYSLYPLK